MNKLYNFYCNTNNDNFPFYAKKFKELNVVPKNPVIFILDNELENNSKPISKLIKTTKLNSDKQKFAFFKSKYYANIISNLYLSTHQLVKGKKECEIEDLFDDNTLDTRINKKTFERDPQKYNDQNNYGKAAFADYVSKNYKKIDFNNFKPLLDTINEIVSNYTAT